MDTKDTIDVWFDDSCAPFPAERPVLTPEEKEREKQFMTKFEDNFLRIRLKHL